LLTEQPFRIHHAEHMWSGRVEKRHPHCVSDWKSPSRVREEGPILERAHGIYPGFTCTVDEAAVNPCRHAVRLKHNTQHVKLSNMQIHAVIVHGEW
jgi:hypothetical protein